MEHAGTAFAGHLEQEYAWGHLALLVFNKNTLQAALQLPKHHAKCEQEKGKHTGGKKGKAGSCQGRSGIISMDWK